MIGAIAAAGMQGIVTDGLVLHLDAGNSNSYSGVGTTWYDLSGNGNNATLVNGVGFDSSSEGSVMFDGINDYCNVANNNSLNQQVGFSIDIWIKFSENINKWEWIVAKNSDSGSSTGYFVGRIGDNGEFAFRVSNINVSIDKSKLQIGIWYNIVCTALAGDKLKMYMNGILSSYAANVPSPIVHNNYNLGINKTYYYSSPNNFKGNIAKVKMYSKALTQSEVTQNFNADRARYGL